MILKVLIVLLFVAMLVSLAVGYFYFVKDRGAASKLRLLTALKTRVLIATALLSLIVFGALTGQLNNQAPWDNKPQINVDKKK